MIYFIQAADGVGPIKIGSSRAPFRRVASLEASRHDGLKVLGVCEGSQRYERALHARWTRYRVKGEWFSPVVEILDFIKNHCTTINSQSIPGNKRRRARGLSDHAAEKALSRALRKSPLTAAQIANKCGVSARAVEGWRAMETLPGFTKTIVLAREIPQVRALVRELMGEVERDPASVLDQIAKLMSKVQAG